ncbi:EamA family transporter [Pseudoxanthomonas beigongshangi]
MNPDQTPGWFGWALASAAFAALTAIFAKVGVQRIDSDMATWIRTAVVMAALSVFIAATGKWSDPAAIPARTWTFLVLSGLAAGASWLCYFRALQLGDASQVAPIDKASLVLVLIFAWLFLGERPTLRDGLGMLLVAGGVLVLGLKR